jgi:CAAX protease family protein
LKDAVRLAVYFAAIIVIGALIAPILFWVGHSLAQRGVFVFLARFGFESFFHRALLVAALILIWPLLHSLKVRGLDDIVLTANPRRWRHLTGGFLFAVVPLLSCGALLIVADVYSLRPSVDWSAIARTVLAAIAVPCIEETFFRGLVLGILLRSGRTYLSMFVTSALFSVIHFLKAPEVTSPMVTWTSGFESIAHSFAQFSEPILVLAAFTTLFLLGWILADARVRTRSLWLPIGLHAGWIFGNGVFSKFARHEMILLPWLGRNLLVGIIPLGVACVTWIILRLWLRHEENRTS